MQIEYYKGLIFS